MSSMIPDALRIELALELLQTAQQIMKKKVTTLTKMNITGLVKGYFRRQGWQVVRLRFNPGRSALERSVESKDWQQKGSAQGNSQFRTSQLWSIRSQVQYPQMHQLGSHSTAGTTVSESH